MKSTTPAQTLAKLNLFLNRFISLPFDDRAAEVYGRIRARLSAIGTPNGPNDLFIASIAIANNLTLITHNTREFSRIDGLQLEDWEWPA
jgi:tRNA(fMet)-specific endonuclease VapC